MDYVVELVERKCLKMQSLETRKSILKELKRQKQTPDIIAAGCPFCNTMMTDGVKTKKKRRRKSDGHC
jgi:Fe-S oxidoreductase